MAGLRAALLGEGQPLLLWNSATESVVGPFCTKHDWCEALLKVYVAITLPEFLGELYLLDLFVKF